METLKKTLKTHPAESPEETLHENSQGTHQLSMETLKKTLKTPPETLSNAQEKPTKLLETLHEISQGNHQLSMETLKKTEPPRNHQLSMEL